MEGWDYLLPISEFTDELKLKSASSVSSTYYPLSLSSPSLLLIRNVCYCELLGQPITGSAKKNQIPKLEVMCQGKKKTPFSLLLSSPFLLLSMS